jgi:FtsH-binding integral membrane protein
MNTPTTLPLQKPEAVSTAIKLLYATLVIGALRSALEWSHQTQAVSPDFVLFVMIFTFAFIVWLIYKMDRGRNWARITFLVFFILGVPMSVLPLLRSLSYSPVSGVLGLLQVVLQIVALCILFGRSARPWFRPTATPPPLSTSPE